MNRLTTLVAFVLIVISSSLHAATLQRQLKQLMQQGTPPQQAAAELILTVAEFIGDAEKAARDEGKQQKIEGREQEANDILDTLVRMKSRVPVLVAPPGVGKTAIVQRAIQKTIAKDFPAEPAYQEALGDAHWIQLTAGGLVKIMKSTTDLAKMKAIEDFFDAVITVEKALETNIITFRDELHSLDESQVEALLPYLESQSKSIRLVGATNGDKLTLAFRDNEAFVRRTKAIPVAEFDDETTLALVDKSWIPGIQEKYNVTFGDDAKKRLIRFGTLLNPDGGKFDAAIKFAQDLAIWNLRNEQKKVLTQEDLFQFYKEKTRFPVDPFDKDELNKYLNHLKGVISSKLVGQDRMIDDAVTLFRDVILGTKKDMGVLALNGPTGTGKSELAKLLASHGFNNPRSFIKIDCNEYQNDDMAMKKLFGAEGGLVTSNSRVGILPEYFDDPSQGKYGGVVLFDEAEKAHPKFWQRLMEFFEEGSFRGGDGKIRKAKRHLVILTSNRGDTILFPEAMRTLDKKRIMDHAAGIKEADIKRLFQIRMNGNDDQQIPTSVLNRVDRWSVSVPLHLDDIKQIAENYTAGEIASLEDHFQVELRVQPSIVHRVGETSFDPQYGARPVERALQRFFNEFKDKILASTENVKGQKMEIVEKVISEDIAEAVVMLNGKEIFTVELPRLILDEPLLSTTFGETLKSIDEILPKSIIGQDDAIARVREVLITYLSTPVKRRSTLGIMLVGLTGVGKTELAKATAHAVFGSPDRAEVLPMGEIQHEAEFNNLVGSPPGYVGSDQVRAFERALMNHPEGGVIVFDEVTNLGGRDKAIKEALFKRLYNFFEEGKWTSAATGVTYDLRKYVFFLTGNDGEALFQGNTSEIMRLTTWKGANKPAAIHKMLVDKGVPEPFLGRMADTIMMKPLLRAETAQIAHKLLEPIFSRFQDLGFTIDLPQDFDEQFGKMFFTQQKGARSLRSMAHTRVNSLISEALVLTRDQMNGAKDKWIKIGIKDNLDPKPYIDDPEYAAKVELVITIGAGKEEILSLSRDVTQFAALDKKLSKEQATATAYHEAGHAVMNDPEITGTDLKYLTILGSEGNLGFALYDNDDASHRYKSPDKKVVEANLARVLGGQVAMVMAGFTPDGGWGNDLEKARRLAGKYVIDWALNKELLGVLVDKDGNPILTEAQQNKAAESMDKILKEAVDIAIRELTLRWDLIEMTAGKLLEQGYLNETEFRELKAQWKEKYSKGPVAKPKQPDCADLLVGR